MMKFFKSEADFQRWVAQLMEGQNWHVQPLDGDPKYPGIPDITAAHESYCNDFWIELKVDQRTHSVWDNMHKPRMPRPLTTQQHNWLAERAQRHEKHGQQCCGVLVAWRTHYADYVTWTPISLWHDRILQTLATWALLPSTDTVAGLESGKPSFAGLFNKERKNWEMW